MWNSVLGQYILSFLEVIVLDDLGLCSISCTYMIVLYRNKRVVAIPVPLYELFKSKLLPPPISTWQISSTILFEECVLPLKRPTTTSMTIIHSVKTSIVIFIGYMCTILVKRSNGSTPKHEKIVKIHIFPPIATMGLHKHDPIMFHGHVFHEALSWTPTAILHAFGSIYYKIWVFNENIYFPLKVSNHQMIYYTFTI